LLQHADAVAVVAVVVLLYSSLFPRYAVQEVTEWGLNFVSVLTLIHFGDIQV